jgi:hypothetical protein
VSRHIKVPYDGDWVQFAKTVVAQRDAAYDTIDRLRAELAKSNAERDEARREICELRADLRVKPTFKREVAAERGWDCFAPHATDVRVQNGGEP